MTLRPTTSRPQDAAVPHYDSHVFGKYGQRVRIYRLQPGGNFYIEYDHGKRRRVIRENGQKIRDLDRALDYLSRFYRD